MSAHEFMRKDGVKLPVLLSVVAERALHGELVGALAICMPGVAAR